MSAPSTTRYSARWPSPSCRPVRARPFADAWTGPRAPPHLAGRLGSAILSALLDQKWLLRRPKDRALNITDLGNARLDELGLTLSDRDSRAA